MSGVGCHITFVVTWPKVKGQCKQPGGFAADSAPYWPGMNQISKCVIMFFRIGLLKGETSLKYFSLYTFCSIIVKDAFQTNY